MATVADKNSCKNNDSDYDDDDSTVIYWALTWAKPFKTLTSCTFTTTLEDFISSTQQIKHPAQGSTANKPTTQNPNQFQTQKNPVFIWKKYL